MKIIVGKNATGKTRELLQYSLSNNIPILAVTESKANSLKEKSLVYFSRPANVVTLVDLIENAEISENVTHTLTELQNHSIFSITNDSDFLTWEFFGL